MGTLDVKASRHVNILIAITQKLFIRGQQKHTFLKKSSQWLSKNVKVIFIGTASQKLDGPRYKLCHETCIFA